MQASQKSCPNCNKMLPISAFYIYFDGMFHSLKGDVCLKCMPDFLEKQRKLRQENEAAHNLEVRISGIIRARLKKFGGFYIKDIFDYLPYSPKSLKIHIEQQFEPWMNWNNWGKYVFSFWDDGDINTWKWNLDHIIPKSNFPYKSVYDPLFQECWALDNLRPLSAKQNVLDGANKVRHMK